jgi:hypothetical protein
MLETGLQGGAPSLMTYQSAKIWEIAAGATLVAGAAAAGIWVKYRKRPTQEELEVARRQFLALSGRIVDGTMLDCFEVKADDGRMLTMLLYDYVIGGVDYECSQDVTNMGHVVNIAHVQSGLPCSVRYQPGNPQNSIVVAEGWSGLRVIQSAQSAVETPAWPDPGEIA